MAILTIDLLIQIVNEIDVGTKFRIRKFMDYLQERTNETFSRYRVSYCLMILVLCGCFERFGSKRYSIYKKLSDCTVSKFKEVSNNYQHIHKGIKITKKEGEKMEEETSLLTAEDKKQIEMLVTVPQDQLAILTKSLNQLMDENTSLKDKVTLLIRENEKLKKEGNSQAIVASLEQVTSKLSKYLSL